MKTCPDCGHDNPDTAVYCGQCNRVLPPAFWTLQRLYLLGIGLGLIPLILLLVAWSEFHQDTQSTDQVSLGAGTVAMWLYLLQLVVGVVCLFSRRARHVGHGLLTMVLVDPVVAAIGCGIIASRPQ